MISLFEMLQQSHRQTSKESIKRYIRKTEKIFESINSNIDNIDELFNVDCIELDYDNFMDLVYRMYQNAYMLNEALKK